MALSAMDVHVASTEETRCRPFVRNIPLLAEALLQRRQIRGRRDRYQYRQITRQCLKMLSGSEISIYTILDERARELSYEERRWPTLLRMGSSLNGGSNEVMKKQLLQNAMYTSDFPFYTGTIEWTLFPIPVKYIQMNSEAELEQNPGWK